MIASELVAEARKHDILASEGYADGRAKSLMTSGGKQPTQGTKKPRNSSPGPKPTPHTQTSRSFSDDSAHDWAYLETGPHTYHEQWVYRNCGDQITWRKGEKPPGPHTRFLHSCLEQRMAIIQQVHRR